MNVYIGEILDSDDTLSHLYDEDALEALPISTAHRKVSKLRFY